MWWCGMRTLVIKTVFVVIGAILAVNGLLLAALANMTAGIIMSFALGVVFLVYGLLFKTVNRVVPKFIIFIFAVGIVSVVAFSSFLFIYGNSDNVKYNENAIIVLGSGIRGEKPTKNLVGRLERAVEFWQKNPDAVIVVSGGQGPQEDITEGLAMERYLISRGVPADKIIKEEKATSTYENFVFSKQLLDEYFDGDYSVAFVTNDYHVFRAKAIAKIAGLDNTVHLHSSTPLYLVLPSCLRECLAVMKLWVLGR